jgi:hypothetical protein
MEGRKEWSEGTSPLLGYIRDKVSQYVYETTRDDILRATAKRNYIFPIADEFYALPNETATLLALKSITLREPHTVCFSMGNPFGPIDRKGDSPVPDWITLNAYLRALPVMLRESMALPFHELIERRFREIVSKNGLTSVRADLEEMIIQNMMLGSDAELLWDGIGAMVRSCVEPRPFNELCDALYMQAWQSATRALVYWLTFCIGGKKEEAELLEPIVELLPKAIPLGILADEKFSIVLLTR